MNLSLFKIFFGAALCVAPFALAANYAPALPLSGWATQNGGTTGGAKYGSVTVDNVSDLKKYAEAGNKTIYIKPGTYAGTILVGSNVTLYGYPGVVITQPAKGSGIKISGVQNVIVRNISVQGVGAIDEDDEDCLQINHEAKNIWIDHVHVYDGHDGNMDIVNQSNYVTVSWSKFTYTSKSKNHQFSNLFGNSDTKTGDANALKITVHHSWWGEGVKERMPRVRFGQVHVVNNLFNSSTGSYCVRAAMKANIRVEKNVFIGVQDPLNYNNRTKEDANVNMIGNYYEKIKLTKNGDTLGQGTAFTPPYSMSITDVSTQAKAYALRDSIMAYAGPTLPAPGSSEVTPISSSSITKSSSSTAKSSSSVKSSSSSAKSSSSVAAAATLTKHGIGSTNQSVKQGESIQEFYFTIENATSATVSGLPEGLSGKLNGSDFTISGTVSSNAEAKAYKFTVTTTGATQNASKSGTITVLQKEIVSSSSKAEISSSSEKVESSSSEKVSSSSEEISSSSEEISSSSSKTTALLKSKDSRQLKLNSLNLKSGISLELNLSQAGIVKISIMNAVGSVIYSENLSAHTGVNAFNLMPKNLTAGTYYMNIRGLGMNESKRVYLR
ncbi:MAG: pectate lyase [Hallerella porci]|uniref:pectate lyase family protein n=1 Tax=Hallerella TaxID=2815788 RepID=UPI0025837609|nr:MULTISPECIES: pectate lyase [Hallerella]MCI5601392.1 pectate lyase [Hallerella sp.]MDY3921721.1 pectate lyase [Hallerella porci]